MLKKILYVDDESINLELLRMSISKQYEVITAFSGEEGLGILERDSDIKLIITDLKMPGMDGLEFIRKVKEADENRLCVLLTGFIESDLTIPESDKKLIFRYLLKPCRRTDLFEMLEAGFNLLDSE